MEELGLVGDLAVVAVAAVFGGMAARLLRLPTIVGYLAAGIAIGPHTPGPSGDIEDVRLIADLGVALLMFTLGIEFSLREVRQYRWMALGGGVGVTVAMAGLGTIAGLALGLEAEEAVIAGMAVSVASSMVAFRLLEDHGLLGATAGRLTIVTALVQDLAVIFMLTTIPAMAGDAEDVPTELALAVAKAGALLIAVFVGGTWLLPRVLGRVAASRARELFLVAIVAMALGTAAVSAEAGLSIAFGAFLAGLLISESEYAHRTLTEVLPLREIFAVVFFVAIGMLIEPDAFRNHLDIVLALTAVAVLGKIVLIGGVAALLGYPLRTAVPTAVALGSMGEFSFIIGEEALDEGVISADLTDALLASVLLSIIIAPLLFAIHKRVLEWAREAPVIGPVLKPRTAAFIPNEARLVNHAIIVGYTTAGRALAAALARRGFRYSVIDEDPVVFRQLSADGVPIVLGNAAIPSILEQAGIKRAWILAITVLDQRQVESVAATARQLNRRIDVVARANAQQSRDRLHLIGVARVVDPELEVAMQFVRHTLQRFGMTSQEVQTLILRLGQSGLGESDGKR
ncbi:MAG: cation:proton antiporter [Dehalococcoidia bacterium]